MRKLGLLQNQELKNVLQEPDFSKIFKVFFLKDWFLACLTVTTGTNYIYPYPYCYSTCQDDMR